jgi:hypothetical protein
MQNPRILRILRQAEQENRQEKACLIEDIFKVKKLLFGLGETQHDEFLNTKEAVKLYDYLHDLDHTALRIIQKEYERRVNEIVISKIGVLA